MNGLINRKDLRKFVFAGNAIFTLKNPKTGNRFTFKVKQPRKQRGIRNPFYFVYVLTGTNNESEYNYTFIGTANWIQGFRYGKSSKININSKSVKVVHWFFLNIDRLPDYIQVFHEGRCGKCGRKLTVPESIESGFGPECIKFV